MILITGASGFLGKRLTKTLSDNGCPVRALYNTRRPSEAESAWPGVEWQRCDLLDIFAIEEAFKGITEVYHCAAKVSFDRDDAAQVISNNTTGTANVVNAALEADIRKLLFVSSIAALGRNNLQLPLTENDFWEESKNNSAYARSKFLSEMEVWRGIAEGLNAVIINPAIILGAGDFEQGSASLMKLAGKQFPFYTEGVNGWVDAADVVRAMILLMNSDISDARFIVSEGNYSYKEIFTMMALALGKKPPKFKAGKAASGALWRFNALRRLFTGKKSTVTKETARTAQLQATYNNTKLLEALPEFRYTSMTETIEQMAAAYLAAHSEKA